ncbi:MAG: hypothetical protein M1814_005141 [Vezdaea aestivalis]|nr:MAG: hypothetical protein M1814_005141 [Vezdaea aestivalis]
MEKYSQFRDRGTGIAPFFPIPSQSSGAYLPLVTLLFLVRLPLLVTFAATYFLVLQWMPLGSWAKKAMLWLILGVPGIWWIDLQIDGVRRGSLARQRFSRLPQPSTIIASSFTSPIDSLYLAAIFDPLFTASYPHARKVEPISLLTAILRALRGPLEHPPPGTELVDLSTLIQQYPSRAIAVFPECTTTNGRGILAFSPSLLSASPSTRIYPVSLRYTPGDVTTPVPGAYRRFLWNLLSRHTHCIRVRIAESIQTPEPESANASANSYATNYFDTLQDSSRDGASNGDRLLSEAKPAALSVSEKKTLDQVCEALARLGRVKPVALGVKDKVAFVQAWVKHRRR